MDYLEHILEAIGRVERYTADLASETFVEDDRTQDAVIRNLEIIGEACRNIERHVPGFSAQHPDFPLKAAVEMRNVLSHGYFGVDLGVVWRTVQTNLPELRRQVQEILAELSRD
ncbi:DUF86 domain-containing protein [Amaricoccus sp.]|uniref:HepT-like ribonuclease domain-containing protein n=1 Tax=Amaricoccus sp. TaxID=1872485 RepID=UPI001B4CD10A|nr:DUF86 domain-containing protein [Amaricoccus sp.]MBP7000966.1 DUF86 domain-containing protein [Amaricoccus sp.]